MRCENCGKYEANIHVVQVINGVQISRHLCANCAAPVSPMNFANFFATPKLPKSCPACNTTFADFNKHGLFGCPKCYDFFEKDLMELFKNLHGTFLHVGSSPEPDAAETLRKQLQAAVAVEDYEEAARLRDLIKEMQGGASDE